MMSARTISTFFACLMVAAWAPAADARPPSSADARRHPRPVYTQGVDNSQRLDINQISMVVTNTGSIAYDKTTGGAGLEFPKGSGNTAIFAAGPWLGAMVGGQVRAAVSEYTDEYLPGAMVGGVPDDPTKPEYKVYKLDRVYATSAERDMALADYNAGAVPHGAPAVAVLGDGTLGIRGDQMLWCVFNDADPVAHTNYAGNTLPLGVEVQLTAFAFSPAGPPGPVTRTVFLHYRFLNKGVNALQGLYLGMWSDPDLGGPTDDLVGCDVSRSMGYVYNAAFPDAMYGSSPPCVGIDLLRGPLVAGDAPMSMTAFERFIGGSEPGNAGETYDALRGLAYGGASVDDPTSGRPTTFWYPGDPSTGTGWVDMYPSDRRMILSSGPVNLSPGQSQEVDYAIVTGQGFDRLSSILSMRCDDDAIQAFFDRSFSTPLPDELSCGGIVNCPRTADYWAQQSAQGNGEFTPAQLAGIAQRVDAACGYFDWNSNPLDSLRATLDVAAATSPRSRAQREFAALLCNVVACSPPVTTPASGPVGLDPGAQVDCPGTAKANLYQVAKHADLQLVNASYRDLNPAHPVPFVGVDWRGQGFGGGAGTADRLIGGTLISYWTPDSFMTVEIRFDRTHAQNAYRFLSLEPSPGGTANSFVYGGFRPVPFTCWDVGRNMQLDVGFTERTLCDGAGTILPPAMQPATFDSTWAPDTSADGGRECLIIFRRSYDGTAKPEISGNGARMGSLTAALYVLWPRLLSATSIVDDGDAFRFTWGVVAGPSPSVDATMMQLASINRGDPAAEQGYSDITACLSAINAGIGIGATCSSITQTRIAFVAIDAAPERVTVTWRTGGSLPSNVQVERREVQGTWAGRGTVVPDARGSIVYEDTDVVPGRTYSYRLRVTGASGTQWVAETSVLVPLGPMLSLGGFRPNPAGRGAQIAFSLADNTPATLWLFDIAGRCRFSRNVGALGPGAHTIPMDQAGQLPSGIYLIRLTQGRWALTRKALAIR